MSYIKFNALIARRYINRTANLIEKPLKLSRYLTDLTTTHLFLYQIQLG